MLWYYSNTFPAISHINMITIHPVVIVKEVNESETHLSFFPTTPTLKFLNPYTFLSLLYTFIIIIPRQVVCVWHEFSPFTSYTDTQPWQICTKVKLNHILNPIYRKYRLSKANKRISVHMSTQDTDNDDTATILHEYLTLALNIIPA